LLCAWAGLDADSFLEGSRSRKKKRVEPLAMISTVIANDPNLSRDGARAMDAMVKATYEQFRKQRS
jgi:hypothetical protein